MSDKETVKLKDVKKELQKDSEDIETLLDSFQKAYQVQYDVKKHKVSLVHIGFMQEVNDTLIQQCSFDDFHFLISNSLFGENKISSLIENQILPFYVFSVYKRNSFENNKRSGTLNQCLLGKFVYCVKIGNENNGKLQDRDIVNFQLNFIKDDDVMMEINGLEKISYMDMNYIIELCVKSVFSDEIYPLLMATK